MKLNINFNIWFVVWIFIVCLTLVYILIAYNNLIKAENEYNIKLRELTQENIEWIFNCDSSWQSGWYDCGSMQFRNITGYYCNGTIICQNLYREIRK